MVNVWSGEVASLKADSTMSAWNNLLSCYYSIFSSGRLKIHKHASRVGFGKLSHSVREGLIPLTCLYTLTRQVRGESGICCASGGKLTHTCIVHMFGLYRTLKASWMVSISVWNVQFVFQEVTYAPFTLFPTPVPKAVFQQALAVQTHFNTLVDKISQDSDFLEEALAR